MTIACDWEGFQMGVTQTTHIAHLEAEVRRLGQLARDQQEVLSAIELIAQRHNHPGVNTGAHTLAASILAKIAAYQRRE